MGTGPSRESSESENGFLDLKSELEEEEDRCAYVHGQSKFISLGFITDLFKPGDRSKLRLSLENDLRTIASQGDEWQVEGLMVQRLVKDWQIGDDKIDDLEEYVRTQASKLYAILLLLGQSQVILPLYKRDHPITDSIFDQSDIEGDEAYCLLEWLHTQEQLKRFASKFYETQWRIPPRLGRFPVPKFPSTYFRFPYLGKVENIGQGINGEVLKVKVAKGHLEPGPKAGYITVSE